MADIYQIIENNETPKSIEDRKARTNIAPYFEPSNANAAGDLILSDTGILYRFNAAYSAGTSWSSRTSKEEVNLAEIKAPLDSPAFTGIPTAPTAVAGTSNTQIATTAYADTSSSNAIAPVKSDIGIVEDTNTATHTINAGQYVIWKGNLYTANTTIANGAALSSSNLTQVTNGGLNDVIKYEISSNGFTPDATNVSWTWGGTHLYISGKMRILVVSVTVKGTSTDYYTIGRVASDHFPPEEYRAVCIQVNGEHSRLISIDTAGYVKIYRPVTDANYWAEIVYMVP